MRRSGSTIARPSVEPDRLAFLIDEDVDASVGRLLATKHQVDFAVDVFGPQTKDRNNVAWARAERRILVTADRALAVPLRGNRRCACLFLRDLGIEELSRVMELLQVIEQEAQLAGPRFWMQISSELYVVGR